MLHSDLIKKGLRFLIVGSVGFVTDAATLLLATHKLNLDPYSGRLLSFSIALLVTWLLNSTFTFKSGAKRNKRHFASYVAVQVSSFGLNYAIYSLLVWQIMILPIVALTIASVIAMFYSFTAMNMWVFKDRHQ
ncbi:GtrA family protein [Thalassospira sp. CH_XMU1448-2]|uniref:GtrA family protein n=1 Tax=Thalassospira sp. CH_XMU1448-2 TaxID=3107773 RepID=UPI0030097752